MLVFSLFNLFVPIFISWKLWIFGARAAGVVFQKLGSATTPWIVLETILMNEVVPLPAQVDFLNVPRPRIALCLIGLVPEFGLKVWRVII